MSLAERLEHRYSALLQGRGAHYVQAGRVRVERADASGVDAIVQCTRDFHVSLDLTHPDLGANCECTYFGGAGVCKHVWAVILAAEDAVSVTTVEAAKKGGKKGDGSANSGNEIIYFLPVTTPAESTMVHVYQQSLDPKSGEPVLKPRRVRRAEVRHLPRPEDRRLLSLLFGILSQQEEGVPDDFDPSGIPYRVECSQFQLNDENCRVWLRLLAESERFFLATDDRSDVIEWHDAPWLFGLKLEAPPLGGEGAAVGFLRNGDETRTLDDVDVILDSGAVVIDGKACPLDVGADPTWLRKVLKGGGKTTLPDADFDDTVCKLVESGELPAIDLPPDWKWESELTEPQPVLRLRLLEAGKGRRKGVRCRVFFDYEGRRVAAPDPGEWFCDPDKRRVAQRNRDAESTAMEFLRTLPVEDVAEPTAGFDLEVPAPEFASVVDQLVDAGWSVESKEQRYRGAGRLALGLKTHTDWFELEGTLELGSISVPFPQVLAAVRKGENIVRLDDGTVGILPDQWIERVRLLGNMGQEDGEILRFSAAQGWILDALLAGRPEVSADERFEHFHERLRSFAGVEAEWEVPSFQGELRPYQRDGLGWMRFLREFGLGGCLADDMGLGKTVQVLAVLAEQKEETGAPTLVIAPRSVVYNWVDEAHRFTPELKVLEYGGAQRLQHLKAFEDYDIIVTSYGVLRRDILELRKRTFHYVVLDEAQAIKNPSSKTAKCARLLEARHRLALTGTPIENNIYDLWSIFEFLNPGMLGSTRSLNRFLATGNEDEEEGPSIDLGEALRPFLLRRTKEQVATELPEKTEQTLVCRMEGRQLELYQELREHYRSTLLARVDSEGMNATRMHVLEALLRLRQVACHPALIGDEFDEVASCKLDALIPQLLEVITEGHKCLVFSQFTTFLALVKKALDDEKVVYEYLDGRTRDRQKRVERFQNDEDCKVFLVSLKAGGVGLNLTAADYVYILDPWWNPAVEAQAVDRAHRIGQDRHVFAYRLITRESVEEKIVELKSKKQELADAVIRADQHALQSLTREDLELLLS